MDLNEKRLSPDQLKSVVGGRSINDYFSQVYRDAHDIAERLKENISKIQNRIVDGLPDLGLPEIDKLDLGKLLSGK